MIELPDDSQWIYVNKITIQTPKGEADIYKNLEWDATDKEFERYLNINFGKYHERITIDKVMFGIAIFMLADMASHELGGEITNIRISRIRESDDRDDGIIVQ